jgi:hypothetical protein
MPPERSRWRRTLYATAVTGNLTVTGQTSGGYLFIGPVATNNPTQLDSQLPRR